MTKTANSWFKTLKQNLIADQLVHRKKQQAIFYDDYTEDLFHTDTDTEDFYADAKDFYPKSFIANAPTQNAVYTLDQALMAQDNEFRIIANNNVLKRLKAQYHIAILNAADDYFVNYLAGYINLAAASFTANRFAFYANPAYLLPMQCLVFIDQQDQCFLALPIVCDLSKADQVINHVPIIKTTVEQVQTVLGKHNLYHYGQNYYLFWQPMHESQADLNTISTKYSKRYFIFRQILCPAQEWNVDYVSLFNDNPRHHNQKDQAVLQSIQNKVLSIIGSFYVTVLLQLKPKYLDCQFKPQTTGTFAYIWQQPNITPDWKKALKNLNQIINMSMNVMRWQGIVYKKQTDFVSYNLQIRTELLADIAKNLHFKATKAIQSSPISIKKAGKPLVAKKGLNKLLTSSVNNAEREFYLVKNKQKQVLLATCDYQPQGNSKMQLHYHQL